MRNNLSYQAMMLTAVLLSGCATANADVFFPIESVSVEYPDGAGGAYWPETNLIQGPDVGFDSADPYEKILDGDVGNWVTDACGFPCDYIEVFGSPIINLDLGQDRALTEISTWGYSDTNTNGMAEFMLRFATQAEGASGYGTSIAYNPTFGVEDYFEFNAFDRRSFPFSEEVTARYVELTPTLNYFDFPGDGSGDNGWGAGGDRVGIGEIAFQAPDDFNPGGGGGDDLEFYDIQEVYSSTSDTDLYLADNLIQGPGVGFLDRAPHVALGADADFNWVTEACGFPCDYLESFDAPEIVLDLGEDVLLDEINVWGYASSNSNGVRQFSLAFATETDGEDGFGNTIAYNPTFDDVDIDASPRQSFPFDETVTARYVKFTALDNYFEDPGDGTGDEGFPAGGDRIGLGEIAFPIPGTGGGAPGDFNGDGVLDVLDIDDLTMRSAAMTNPPEYDLNADTLVDVLDVNVWVKDLFGTWIGDADLDGEFNSADLVTVLASGTYEQDVDSKWSTGDFSGDGRTDSADLVAALADGGYEQGPRQAVAAVPEPAGLVLVIFAAFGLLSRMRQR